MEYKGIETRAVPSAISGGVRMEFSGKPMTASIPYRAAKSRGELGHASESLLDSGRVVGSDRATSGAWDSIRAHQRGAGSEGDDVSPGRGEI